MNVKALALSIGLFLSLFCIQAAAQVEQTYGDIVMDEAAYIEELNAYFMSAEAKNPRMSSVVRSVVNGTDPTTHILILEYADFAGWEVSMDAAYKSKDFAKMQRRAVAVAKGNSEALYLRVADNGKSWKEGDYIFAMGVDVSEDEAFVKAVQEYMISSLGKKAPGALRLLEARAGSDSSYVVAFSAPTFVAGNKFMDEHTGSKDMEALIAKIGKISKPTGSSIYKVIKVWK